MKNITLVAIFALAVVVVGAAKDTDCSSKCQCSDVRNKTEFCGIQGFTRKTFSSSCEMVCYNCQEKANFKYQSSGKCPENSEKSGQKRRQSKNKSTGN